MTHPDHRRNTPRSFIAWTVVVMTLLAGACGSSGSTATEQTAQDRSTTGGSAIVAPTAGAAPVESPTAAPSAAETTPSVTATESPTAEPTPEAVAFTETSDLAYRTIDGDELLMDVFVPAGEGPWPVVVSFHGLASNGKDFGETVALAQAAATQGMLVFTPTWIAGNPFPFTSQTFETWDDTVSCAIAFAQQRAAGYGGDPARTVVDGFSAGAGAALLFASQEPRVAPIQGCETAELPTPVAGFVIGDVEAWLHSQNFDDAFAAEPAAIQARQAALIGPSSWQHGAGVQFHLWVTENGTSPRQIGDPTDDSSWFAQRDPDGSIQADLERLGQFADGVVTYVDTGELLELRLAEAGIDVTLHVYPGGHTMLDKVPELVDYLYAAASE